MTENAVAPRGRLKRMLDVTITGWRLLPFVVILIVTNVAAWFRLESIVASQDREACTDVAEIHTALRRAFLIAVDLFPDAPALVTLSDAIAVEFPLTEADCPS